MMRIAVTGSKGQVATSLIERAEGKVEIVALGRPAFDLTDRAAVIAGLDAARPDVVVNAAAYTAVDKAEAEEADAVRVNGEGAGHVAEAAARGRRLTHVRRIATADYPTPARRPANSRLDNEKLARVYGVRLPEWRQSVEGCCDRLLS